MDAHHISQLLDDYEKGSITHADALARLTRLPFEDLGFAMVDHHRALRQGYPEVVFCSGKTPEQIAAIARAILDKSKLGLLATRADRAAYEAIRAVASDAIYHENCGLVSVSRSKRKADCKPLYVITAGTSDMPVAEEAVITAEILGLPVTRIYDAGVAGLHRILSHVSELQKAGAVIVVAGMEGALASVVGGLVACPVIAVPTSVGYGAAFGGITALLSMLNSCAAGVGVCNIDNGFGAAWLAGRILLHSK